jgi:phosphatidate cytidylyltransferase
MLRQRIVTALVLLAVLVPALLAASPWPFALLTLVMTATAGWEWSRLNGVNSATSIALGFVLALACAAVLAGGRLDAVPAAMWWVVLACWVAGGAALLRMSPSAWLDLPRALRLAIGLLGLWAAWLALIQAKALGVNFLLSVLALVWAADIAAYFGGRAFGRRKLAPAISPGKSWEGVWSGMLGVLVLAVVWIALDRHWPSDSASLYSRLLERMGLFGLVLALMFLSAISVVGDLVESLVKRAAGAKDSSRLLPGHGGVLDRIDALLPVVPLSLALVSMS